MLSSTKTESTELIPNPCLSVPSISLPKHKGYTWVPDTPSQNQNEIIGNIDSHNILNNQRRHAHSSNSVSCLHPDPKTYLQAIQSPEKEFWIDAIKTELDNMSTHQVWTPSNHLSHSTPLTTTWVFKKKTDKDGNLTKFKAKLCVRGFSQKEGIYYDEVFAPTGRLTSLWLPLTFCSLNKFPVHQMDVRCAFLNGKPKEELYIFYPDGLPISNNLKTLRLNKSLYRLKQSPRYKLKPFYLYVQVDDLLFGGSWVADFKAQINLHFDMEDLHVSKYALGILINQKEQSNSLLQDKMISKILSEFQVDKSRGNTSPLPSNYQELKDPKLPKPEHPPFNYRQVIGLLQYLVQCTRPDLAYSISFVSQLLESPKYRHYQAVIHVLKYLNFIKNLELRLGCKKLTHSLGEIICFTNSDWGGAKENRSFSGSIIYYHGSLGWRSQKQQVVALSSAEAEHNALSSCCQDSEWICQLIFEITNKKITSIIYSDNQSSIALASNRFYHHGTRHINFRLHFIQSLIEDEKIVLKYISTEDMLADLLTKNLPLAKSHNLLKKTFGQEIQSKLTGTGE
ncbi:hypothetical protein O181_046494 [Austropuccinia psidii MF-1]|uniref:Reverse transcriptase Ty1/copia-type domain-containing protein n=1 Tax=Austropuccinia psidii MF-1 TaxID=1389203 RepID=A0A9Q3DP09_9BASI|nr:hypothetical protein [Austropuccinia psidii MF-1]